MISYAAYLRDSGGDSQDLSIHQQQAALTAWAANNDSIITQWFKDEARPGSSVVGRDGFAEMMAYFRDGAPEAGLVVWKMSRFARDISDAQFFRADLRRRGYKVISINDPVPEGPEGVFFEAAIDWMNSRFLEDLSRDVRRGLGSLVKTYGAVPGVPPRGFNRQAVELPAHRDGRIHTVHRWVPDPSIIPIIRLAFELRVAGRSLFEINQATNLFTSLTSYKTFYINKLYIGILEYGDQVIEDYCDPMIDRPTWDAVQEIIKAHANHANHSEGNPNHPRRKNSTYLLSGVVFCVRCGSPLSGYVSGKTASQGYARYHCTRSKRHAGCDFAPIPRQLLDKVVMDTIHQEILTVDNLARLQDITRETESDHQAKLDADLKAARDRLNAITRKIANVTDSLAEAGSSKALLIKLKALEGEEAQTRSDLANLERQAANPYNPLGVGELQNVVNYLLSQEPRTLLEQLTIRVDVDREASQIKGLITYSPPQSAQTSRAPLVAHPTRRTSTAHFTAYMRSWTRKK